MAVWGNHLKPLSICHCLVPLNLEFNPFLTRNLKDYFWFISSTLKIKKLGQKYTVILKFWHATPPNKIDCIKLDGIFHWSKIHVCYQRFFIFYRLLSPTESKPWNVTQTKTLTILKQVIQSKLFITSLVITEYSISDIKLLGTDLFPLKFPLNNRIFT